MTWSMTRPPPARSSGLKAGSSPSLPVLPRQAQVRARPHGHAGLAVIAQGRGYDALARAPEFSLAVPADQIMHQ
jgi:hypothetical protein